MTTDMDTVITKNKDSNLDAQSFNEGGGGAVHCILSRKNTLQRICLLEGGGRDSGLEGTMGGHIFRLHFT